MLYNLGSSYFILQLEINDKRQRLNLQNLIVNNNKTDFDHLRS